MRDQVHARISEVDAGGAKDRRLRRRHLGGRDGPLETLFGVSLGGGHVQRACASGAVGVRRLQYG
jgi:hypothetical protein